MTSVQFDLLDDEKTKQAKNATFDQQISFLPKSPLQYNLDDKEPLMTTGELEIMHLVLIGSTIHDIQLKIFRSIHGVKWRLSNIYHKFGVQHRLALIKLAATKGLQFRLESGVKQTFHLKFEVKDHKND